VGNYLWVKDWDVHFKESAHGAENKAHLPISFHVHSIRGFLGYVVTNVSLVKVYRI